MKKVTAGYVLYIMVCSLLGVALGVVAAKTLTAVC
jgi:hypothetical protein